MRLQVQFLIGRLFQFSFSFFFPFALAVPLPHAHTQVNKHIHTQTHTNTHKHTHINTHKHTQTQTHTHKHTQTHTHKHTYRRCFRHLASRRPPPRELPLAPEWTESLHPIHDGKGAGRQGRLPGRPDREAGNSHTDFCFLQEDTHRQIPRLQLPPPCQGAQRGCAVSEGQG